MNIFPFGSPQVATDVSSPSIDADPFLSADGLSMYMRSTRPGTLGDGDIFIATRATTTSAFSTPVDLPNVSSPADDREPYVTNDGSELWLASSRAGSVQLFRALVVDGAFGAVSAVTELNAPGAEDEAPVLASDGLTVYFASNRDGATQVYVAHRLAMNAPFAAPTLVAGINTAGASPSWISPDSCRLYFTRPSPSGIQLYVATRH